MNTTELAKSFTTLCAAGKFDEAGEKFWADDVVSREPMKGEMALLKGKAAVKAKGDWWAANHEFHDLKVEGPYVNGDQFVLRFKMDLTPKGESRISMDEMAVYTVADGKIVDEAFFYATDA